MKLAEISKQNKKLFAIRENLRKRGDLEESKCRPRIIKKREVPQVAREPSHDLTENDECYFNQDLCSYDAPK